MENRRKHPSYDRWYKLKTRNLLCEEWKVFEQFVQALPENTRKILRKDETKPYSPDNVTYYLDYGEEPTIRRRRVQAEFRKNNPDKIKGYVLKKSYGISLEKYQEMLEQQGHVCAICKKPEQVVAKGKIKALAVDHDHSTGEIRGLLCQACNKALGLLNDDISLFQESINYLQTKRK